MHRVQSKSWVFASCVLIATTSAALSQTVGARRQASKPATVSTDGVWRTSGGKVTLLFDRDRLLDFGVEMQTLVKTAVSDELPRADATFAASGGSESGILFASRNGRFSALAGGSLPTDGEMLLVRSDDETFTLGDFDVHVTIDANGGGNGTITDRRGTNREAFRFTSGMIQFDAAAGRFEWGGAELSLDANWAHEVGIPQAGGVVIGTILIEAPAVAAPNASPAPQGPPLGEGDPGNYGLAGPDVIVGDLQNVQRYGTVGGITAFSVGTTSCNIGTFWLNWMSNTNQHPVIGQNMYRLKNGRFEQIGMSWLKHGFFALSENLCFADCQSTNGSHLGVHCSDPYESSLNGDQSNLGPRYQVNAATGGYPYPPANPATPATIGRRLQVHNTDLDPGQNAGALYFVEGQYVTPDDAAANNKNNNASYRRITVSGVAGSGNYNINLAATTQRQKPGIQAWKDNDNAVTLVNVDIPNDGRMTVGYRVVDNGNGTWTYEYAIYNMNSDRAAQSFSVPVGAGINITNIGFHDVDHHSGDGIGNVNYDGTDWTASVANGAITWSTQTEAQNANGNALRWGTLYNFRYDADSAPQTGAATLTLFKAGSPGQMQFDVATTGGVPAPRVQVTLSMSSPANVRRGDHVLITATLHNNTTGVESADFWLDGFRPNNTQVGPHPLRGVFGETLSPGQTLVVPFDLVVPNGAPVPSGPWTIKGRVGAAYPGVDAESSVQFSFIP
ncbi:MAG: hypothetical protein HYR85_21685 [Planctomycetes bacterium]|nr:hypothetical protein [Planctomycetota bacterium]MBI3848591.1 hypothetical protein [Planctomycetota bacterium]